MKIVWNFINFHENQMDFIIILSSGLIDFREQYGFHTFSMNSIWKDPNIAFASWHFPQMDVRQMDSTNWCSSLEKQFSQKKNAHTQRRVENGPLRRVLENSVYLKRFYFFYFFWGSDNSFRTKGNGFSGDSTVA